MSHFFALTSRGLEDLTAQEMAPLVDRVVQVAYRRVVVERVVESMRDLRPLLDLRTADDLFVSVGEWGDVGHTRAELERMRLRCADLALPGALAICRNLRPLASRPSFAVTASFVGKRNYSVPELKAVVGQAVETAFGWRYVDDDASTDLNLRLFIEHDHAYLGLRLYATPLHRRAYKVAQIPGSLKPTVAAAMVMLALGARSDTLAAQPGIGLDAYSQRGLLLDPCCGAGTILIEAAAQGLDVRGGDLNAVAVDAARVNWRAWRGDAAGFSPGDSPAHAGAEAMGAIVSSTVSPTLSSTVPVEVWDAQKLPVPAQSVAYVVTNLPWGRQITVDSRLETFYRQVCAEIQRILAPGGRAVLLTSLPHLLQLPELEETQSLEISLFGQTPRIVCYRAKPAATKS